MTSLHLAVEAGSKAELLRLLSSPTFEVDAQDEQGYTALHRAVIKDDLKLVEHLLKAGACLHQATPSLASTPSRYDEIPGPHALHFAAAAGHLEIAQLLLKAEIGAFVDNVCIWEIDVNEYMTYDLRTALLLAVSGPSKRHEALAVQLLEAGAQCDVLDIYESSVLHNAVDEGHWEVAKWILDHGGDVDIQTPCGATPLHLASRDGQLAIAQLLLQYGAKPDIATESKCTPLHYAAMNGAESIFHLLLAAGADPLAQYKFPAERATGVANATILQFAAYAKHAGLVTTALALGVDVQATDDDGCNALHLAASNGDGSAVIKLLLATGELPIDSVCSDFPSHSLPGHLQYSRIANGTALHMACDS